MDPSSEPIRTAFEIAGRLKQNGHTAWYAGGSVRDFLMGRPAHDVDIATSAVPEQVQALFAKTVPVGKQFGVILVVASSGETYEVATFRTEGGYQDGRHPTSVQFTGPEEDARRRDFTVNGLFYDPFEKKVIDYVGGKDDLERKILRAIGDPGVRFEEDKLRLMRAVRFSSSLGFEIDADTWEAVKRLAPRIHDVSAERIRDELVKMLVRPGAARAYDLLSDSGLMKEILPEVERMKGVRQPPDWHPEGDVFVHTRMLLEHLDRLESPPPALALACLFHDVGKPVTFEEKEGKIRFFQHAPVGARMTADIMRRLRFSNQEIEEVTACVENHMKFADVQKMREGKLKRFLGRETFPLELELHRIDCSSSHGMLDNYEFLKRKLVEYAAEDIRPRPFLNGHDVLKLGVEAGPSVREILDEAYELQLEGGLGSRETALEWLKKRLKS